MKNAEDVKVLPVLAPADVAATATPTQYFDLKFINRASLFISLGAITGDTAVVTLECSTAASSNATESAIGFDYRLSSAVATDSMGAIAAAASTDGVTLAATDDNKVLVIDIDPSVVAAVGDDYRYVRAVVTPGASMTAFILSALLVAEPVYAQNSMPSST